MQRKARLFYIGWSLFNFEWEPEKKAREEARHISGRGLPDQMEQKYTSPKAGACLAD